MGLNLSTAKNLIVTTGMVLIGFYVLTRTAPGKTIVAKAMGG